tara:strand:+ start:68 stop:1735 length:1668 start_codon:yes stop_codon:yes gene_type:complete
MGLPKVTYGNYNYGQYANPKAIQYKGGLGEGLAGGALAVANTIAQSRKEQKEEGKKEDEKLKKIDIDSINKAGVFGSQMKKAAGKSFAIKENKKYIRQLKKDFGENEKQFALQGSAYADEYSEKKDFFENILNELIQFRNHATTALKGSDLDIKDIRNNSANLARYQQRKAIENGLFTFGTNEGTQGLQVTFSTNGEPATLLASDIYSDAKSLTPQASYSNSMNSTFQEEVENAFRNFRGVEGITIDDKTPIGNKIYSRLNFKGAEKEIKNYLKSSSSITKIMKDPTFDNETYYEDILGLENYEGTEDEDKLIVEGLVNDMFKQAEDLNKSVDSYTVTNTNTTPTGTTTKVTNFLDTVQATPTTKTKYKTLLDTYDGFTVEKDGKQLTGRNVGALDMIKQVKSADQFKYGTNLTDVLTNEELIKEINLALSDDKGTRETSILRTKNGNSVKNAKNGRLRKKLEALKNKLAAGIGDESKMKAYQLTVIDDGDNSFLVPEFDSNGNFKPMLEIDNNTSLDSHTKVLSLLPNVGTGNTGVKLTTEIYDIVGRYNSYNK